MRFTISRASDRPQLAPFRTVVLETLDDLIVFIRDVGHEVIIGVPAAGDTSLPSLFVYDYWIE